MRSLTTLGLCACAAVVVVAVTAADAGATTVRFTSNVGAFDVDLFDTVTPQTVANFLHYVNSGAYNDTIIHRSVPGFVVQGGGYLNDGAALAHIAQDAPVPNEFASEQAAAPGAPVNVRGTIAMAKLPDDPDSATSEFFFNLVNNSSTLDFQDGGFTTFGTVTGTGMNVLDAIAGLPQTNVGGPFTNLPLAGDGSPTYANLVTFSSVAVVPEPCTQGAAVVGAAAIAAGRRPRRRTA